MFLAGFATFALLYNVQPLLPVFSQEFGISAAQSSLSVSLPTAFLAAGLLIAGSLSEVWGRKPIMVASLIGASVLAVIGAVVPTWGQLLVVRALEGLTTAARLDSLPDRSSLWAGLFDLRENLLGRTLDDLRAIAA